MPRSKSTLSAKKEKTSVTGRVILSPVSVCESCNVCWLEPKQSICYDCEIKMANKADITVPVNESVEVGYGVKVAAAFVKAQKEFAPALKSSTNPHFKSRYAALDICIEAVIDALHSAGLGLMQKTHEVDGGVCVETVFVHVSGETLSGGKLFVPANKNDAQGFGSALTYARRYSLMAACGHAPEDDDAQAAVKASNRPGVVDNSAKGLMFTVQNGDATQQMTARNYLNGRKIVDLNSDELVELRTLL